jgi:hypothetical protein
MKCPIQAFVAFAMFIGGCATKPEAPQTALTGNLIVQKLDLESVIWPDKCADAVR